MGPQWQKPGRAQALGRGEARTAGQTATPPLHPATASELGAGVISEKTAQGSGATLVPLRVVPRLSWCCLWSPALHWGNSSRRACYTREGGSSRGRTAPQLVYCPHCRTRSTPPTVAQAPDPRSLPMVKDTALRLVALSPGLTGREEIGDSPPAASELRWCLAADAWLEQVPECCAWEGPSEAVSASGGFRSHRISTSSSKPRQRSPNGTSWYRQTSLCAQNKCQQCREMAVAPVQPRRSGWLCSPAPETVSHPTVQPIGGGLNLEH